MSIEKASIDKSEIHKDTVEENEQQKKKKRFLILLLLLLLLFSSIGLLNHFGYIRFPWESKTTISGNLKQGDFSKMSDEELLAELQKEVDKSKVSFKINAGAEFDNGNSEGSLFIVNPVYNAYDFSVSIYLDGTDELIYLSGIVPPGYYIDYDKLNLVLEKGTYKAIAYLDFYEDSEPFYQISVDMDLKILN